MQYAAYCRVSTEEQAKGENIQAQVFNINEYCSRNKIIIPEEFWYMDDGFSGAERMRDRPEGNRLLLDVLEGKVGHVLIWRVDRLAREDFVAQEIYRILKGAGVNLTSITEPFNYNEPEGQLMATTFSSFAAYERASIRRRLSEGKARRAREGYLPQGQIPYGYVSRKKQPVESVPEQAEVIRTIFRLYVEEKLSHKKIMEYLTTFSIPCPASAKEGWYPSSDGRWCEFSIFAILNSEFYATGEYWYKPPGKDRIMVPVPPIIDIETFEKARQIAQAKRANTPAPGTYRQYLLRGLVYCGVCGGMYTGTSHERGKYFYYRCGKKKKYIECKMPQVPADILEDACWDDIVSFFSDPDKLVEEVSTLLDKEKKEYRSFEKDFEEIKAMKKTLEQEKKRLMDGYAKGLYDESDLRVALADRNQSIKSLEDRNKALKEQLRSHQETAAALEGIFEIADQIQAIIENADADTKRDLFNMMIDRVEIHPDDGPKALQFRVFYKIDKAGLMTTRIGSDLVR
jgi:site-specific DNA recombinase